MSKWKRACLILFTVPAVGIPLIFLLACAASQEKITKDKTLKRAVSPGDLCPTVQNSYRDLKNPLIRNEENLTKGEWLYDVNCSPCHGGNLDGNGPEADGFIPSPANLTLLVTTLRLPESYLFWRIKEGWRSLPEEFGPWNSAMPVWKKELTDEDIWMIIIYIYEATGATPP